MFFCRLAILILHICQNQILLIELVIWFVETQFLIHKSKFYSTFVSFNRMFKLVIYDGTNFQENLKKGKFYPEESIINNDCKLRNIEIHKNLISHCYHRQ